MQVTTQNAICVNNVYEETMMTGYNGYSVKLHNSSGYAYPLHKNVEMYMYHFL